MARLAGDLREARPFLHAQSLSAIGWHLAGRPVRLAPVQGEAAERFVVFALRVLAVSFAVVGLLYLVVPTPTLNVISDVGEIFGFDSRAPHTQEFMWLSLGFAYMAVITGICLIAQADVVRYRPLLLLLAAGKAASSLTSLAFFVIQDQVFTYLLGFLVDGSLILLALWLWTLVGRIDRPFGTGGESRRLGKAERRTLGAICEAMAPGIDGLPAAERDVAVAGPVAELLRSVPPSFLLQLRLGLRAFEWMPFPRRFSRLDQPGRERVLKRLEGSRLALEARPAADGEALLDPRLHDCAGGRGEGR